MAAKSVNPELGADGKAPEPVRIQRIQVETLIVPITGLTPLISHRFDEKARRQMLEKQTAAKRLREVRDPVAEYQASLYRIAKEGPRGKVIETYGFPASAFRKATIGAARFYDKSVTMKGLTQYFMVRGVLTKADPLALVEIDGEPQMREDTTRLPNGNADVRFRAEFPEWTARLEFDYVASSIDDESLLSLIAAGGQFVGVGDWRPERLGQFGTYEVGSNVEKVKR